MIDPTLLTALLGGTAQDLSQQPQAQPQGQTPINVAQMPTSVPQGTQDIQQTTPGVNSFQPTQLTPHQIHIDKELMMTGRQPYYQTMARNADIANAMQNYTSDPIGTIQNIASIPGAAPMAIQMYQELQQNQRLGVQTQSLENANKDMVGSRVANLLSRATSDNYPQILGMANNYIKQNGMNPDDFNLPQSYDKDAINGLVSGTMSPDQQGVLDYRSNAAQALAGYRAEQAATAEERADNQGAYWQGRLKQAATNAANKQTEASNRQIQAQRLKYGYNMPIQTSHGQMIMQVGPGGTHATVDYPDGNGGTQTFAYKSDGKGGWQKIGRIDPTTGKAWQNQ